jgi:hypothetical protein
VSDRENECFEINYELPVGYKPSPPPCTNRYYKCLTTLLYKTQITCKHFIPKIVIQNTCDL